MSNSETIKIYAQFPTELPLSADEAKWRWVHCLTFGIDKLNSLRLSRKPFKWLRYATGVLVGAHGHLCPQLDSSVHVNYDDNALPAQSVDLYYHVGIDERLRMFPLDPELANTRVVTATSRSTRGVDFCNAVQERDEFACVATDTPGEACEAVHLLSHSKGRSYFEIFTNGRQRSDDDVVTDVDSPRNGLYLNKVLHSILGRHFAILVTPNFAMDTDDVIQAGAVYEERQRRFTSHLFDFSFYPPTALVGQAVRSPNSSSIWPPDVLFDAVYASAVMKHFDARHPDILKPWMKKFYPNGGPMTTAHGDEKHQQDADDKRQSHISQQNRDRDTRLLRKNLGQVPQPDQMDSSNALSMFPFVLINPEKVESYVRECEEALAGRERKDLEAKVNSWREDVTTGLPGLDPG